MKKYKSFFAGMLVMISILALSGTALAASGKLQISDVGIVMFDVAKVKPGDSYRMGSQSIPAAVSYTGTDGNPCYYLPEQMLTDYFNIPVRWDEKQNSVVLGTSPSDKTAGESKGPNPTKPKIGAKVGPYTEIKASKVDTKQQPVGISEDKTHVQSVTSVSLDTAFYAGEGKYVIFRVANNGKERVTWRIGQSVLLGEPIYFPDVDLEPGIIMTRAFEVDSSAIDGKNDFLSVIQGAEGTSGAVDVTYSLMQFK